MMKAIQKNIYPIFAGISGFITGIQTAMLLIRDCNFGIVGSIITMLIFVVFLSVAYYGLVDAQDKKVQIVMSVVMFALIFINVAVFFEWCIGWILIFFGF